MNTYRYKFSVTCPNDGETIHYKLEMKSERMIMVEDIIDSIRNIGSTYQEEIAGMLFRTFGCSMVLKGSHRGVSVTTEL